MSKQEQKERTTKQEMILEKEFLMIGITKEILKVLGVMLEYKYAYLIGY